MEQQYVDYIHYMKNAINTNPSFSEQYFIELTYWSNYHFNSVVSTPIRFLEPNFVGDRVAGEVSSEEAFSPLPCDLRINQKSATENSYNITKPWKLDNNKIGQQTYEHAREQKSPEVVVTKPKTKIMIENQISTLRDLLDILDKYPYTPDIEANIDLLSLNNVREELADIDAMIGLKTFKETLLDQLMYFIQDLHINREHDFKHMVIYGPPGTGKTQIASLVGKMYSKLGILKNGTFKKVTRTDLVAGYLGQTSIKTAKVIQESLGGCLFIDEVYSLGTGGNASVENGGGESGGDSFSKECIDTLCEALSNYKEDLMVIIAGYEKDINESFFKMNQGLPSRFVWRFYVDEYTDEELMRIFVQKVKQNGWFINEDNQTSKNLLQWFVTNHKHFPYFGRDMELLFTYTKISHGRRIFGKSPELRKHLTQEDLDNGLKIYMKNANNNKDTKHKLSESCLGMYL
jgi:SpoVK/Ycf46/Vps4 family AAA+-type ATPase